jgi:hypothetical protein
LVLIDYLRLVFLGFFLGDNGEVEWGGWIYLERLGYYGLRVRVDDVVVDLEVRHFSDGLISLLFAYSLYLMPL